MYDYALVRYPIGQDVPRPWQTDMHVLPRMPQLSSIPAMGVARAPAGTPIPPGASPYDAPVVTREHREAARAELRQIAERERRLPALKRLLLPLVEAALDDEDELDRTVMVQLGLVHPLALCSPLSVETLDEAIHLHTSAEGLWDSTHSSGVVRPTLRGYVAWVGVGSLMRSAGHHASAEAAERAVIERVLELRDSALEDARDLLAGWSEDTPYFSATLATAREELPIHIRRGPALTEERGSSWDLPVVAVWRNGVIERHDERITWDDEQSRAVLRARQQAGEARRHAEVERALEQLRAHPVTAPLVEGDGLRRGAQVKLRDGHEVSLVGPVGLDEGERAIFLVEDDRPARRARRFWAGLSVVRIDPTEGWKSTQPSLALPGTEK